MGKVRLKDIKVGSIIIVRGNFGRELPKKARVTGISKDGKNGSAVIDYKDGGTWEMWAYLHQIDAVVKY